MRFHETLEDHEDVQLEMHDIVKDRKKFVQTFWFVWPVALLANAAVLSAIFMVVRWIFDDANLVTPKSSND